MDRAPRYERGCSGFDSWVDRHYLSVGKSGNPPALEAGERRIEACHSDHFGSPHWSHEALVCSRRAHGSGKTSR
jgi:hypothetical protein